MVKAEARASVAASFRFALAAAGIRAPRRRASAIRREGAVMPERRSRTRRPTGSCARKARVRRSLPDRQRGRGQLATQSQREGRQKPVLRRLVQGRPGQARTAYRHQGTFFDQQAPAGQRPQKPLAGRRRSRSLSRRMAPLAHRDDLRPPIRPGQQPFRAAAGKGSACVSADCDCSSGSDESGQVTRKPGWH